MFRSSSSIPVSCRYCSLRTRRKYPILASEMSDRDGNASKLSAMRSAKFIAASVRRACRQFSRRVQRSLVAWPTNAVASMMGRYHVFAKKSA